MLGSIAFFIAGCMSPLAMLTLPTLILFIAIGLRGDTRGQLPHLIMAGIIWGLLLFMVYSFFGLIPFINFHYQGSGIASSQVGHGLPARVIPWGSVLKNLAIIYIRTAPILLALMPIGIVICFMQFRRWWLLNLSATLLFATHLVLIRHMQDGWTHSSIWFVIVASYGAIAILAISDWTQVHLKIERGITVSLIFTLEIILLVEFFVIPQHIYARDHYRLARELNKMHTSKTVWLLEYGRAEFFAFERKGRRPGDGIGKDFYPERRVEIAYLNDPRWHFLWEGLAEQSPVYLAIANERCLGPLSSIFLKKEHPIAINLPSGKGHLIMKKIKQVGIFGIYRISGLQR